jgi:hypothetical protein
MWGRSPSRTQLLKEQLTGLRSNLEAALAEIEAGTTSRRGPLGLGGPFKRKSALETFLASLTSLASNSTLESLPELPRFISPRNLPTPPSRRRGPEMSGILVAAAAAFAAAGAALLWFGGPRQAASAVARVLPGSTTEGGERLDAWTAPSRAV